MSDANVYFLNQYLDRLQENAALEKRIDEYAQAEVQDRKGRFWPWEYNRIQEAFCEVDIKELDKVAKCFDNDKELAMAVRRIVVGYWFNVAKDKIWYERSQ